MLVGCAADPAPDPAPSGPRWCPQERPAHVIVSDALESGCAESVCAAVAWWADQGVEYLTCAVVADVELSPGFPSPRFIQVLSMLPVAGASGDTRINRLTHECIQAAEVRLDPKYCRRGTNTAAHELGHALGLDHSNDPDNLMWPANLPDKWELTPAQEDHVR